MGKGRAPCCDKSQVKRGPWSPSEDAKLISYIHRHGHDNWRALPKLAGLARCGKSCRLRWVNYLTPDVKRGHFTREEEDSIIRLQQSYGNRWSKIASYLPGRTDNEIKNVWNTYLKKRMLSYNVSPDSAGDESKRESCVTSASSSPSSSFAALGDMEINPGNYKGEGLNKQGHTVPQNKPSNGSVINKSTTSVEAKGGNHDGEQNVDSFLNVKEEVNKPEGAPGKNVDNPFEGSDTEFWSMLGGLATSPKATELIDQILEVDAYQDINFGGLQNTDGETGNDQWLQYLERELGLVSPPPPIVDFDDPNWTRLNYN